MDESSAVPATLVVELDFDTSVLQVIDAGVGAGAVEKMFAYQQTESGATFLFYGIGGTLRPGTLATVVFEAAALAPGGAVLFTRGESSAATEAAEALDVVLEAGAVAITALAEPHDADTNRDGRIGLSEILRIAQLYNAGGFGCDTATEDGFTPGAAIRSCGPHDLDYREQDWRIDLSELLRCVQFYNAPHGAYHANTGTEDGFAPGLE